MDLGNEPPLSVDGGNGGMVDRRRVSAQWFSGTILTGVCGAALMGGAVFASLDGETNFASVPERVETALQHFAFGRFVEQVRWFVQIAMVTDLVSGRGNGALCNGRVAWRTGSGCDSGAYGTSRATGVSRSQTTTVFPARAARR